MCVDVSTVIAGDVQSDSIQYVASKDIYQLQYTPLSVSGDKANTEVVVRYVSFLCVTNAMLDHFRTGFFAH